MVCHLEVKYFVVQLYFSGSLVVFSSCELIDFIRVFFLNQVIVLFVVSKKSDS